MCGSCSMQRPIGSIKTGLGASMFINRVGPSFTRVYANTNACVYIKERKENKYMCIVHY